MMGYDSEGAHGAACLDEAGRPIPGPEQGEICGVCNSGGRRRPEGQPGQRRVISRSAASCIVAVPGLVLLGVGMILFNRISHPVIIIGEEPFALYFCALAAITTGTAALAASVFLVASNMVTIGAKQSRFTILALGLAVIAALAAFA